MPRRWRNVVTLTPATWHPDQGSITYSRRLRIVIQLHQIRSQRQGQQVHYPFTLAWYVPTIPQTSTPQRPSPTKEGKKVKSEKVRRYMWSWEETHAKRRAMMEYHCRICRPTHKEQELAIWETCCFWIMISQCSGKYGYRISHRRMRGLDL